MAPLEYTLTTTRPPGSSTNPVDCRNTGSSLTNAPVASVIAEASAPYPTGNRKPCLAMSSCAPAGRGLGRRAGRPGRGWDAVVIGEYERAFYGGQCASMAPLFEHYSI